MSGAPWSAERHQGPMAGVRVIDASTLIAGPMISTYLADFGADVIKLEHPAGGDSVRNFGWKAGDVSIFWKSISRNKRACTLNLSKPEGQELLRELVAEADVLVENFRPGTMERWNLGYERLAELNPGLIMVRTTGFGQTGPYRNRPGFGTLAEAMSGVAAVLGEPGGAPIVPPFPLGDGVAGLYGAMATLMALRHRDATGEGQYIDLSLWEPLVAFLGPQVTAYEQTGVLEERNGSRGYFTAPRNVYRTADDKWLTVSTSAQSTADRLLEAIGRRDLVEDGRYATHAKRNAHADELDGMIADWVRQRSAEEVLALWEDHAVTGCAVLDAADLAVDPHLEARGMFVELEDEELGPIRLTGALPRLSASPGEVRHPGRPMGADNAAVYGDGLGRTPEQLEALRAAGAI